MRKMRVRHWLMAQKSKNIYLSNENVAKLEQENLDKLVKLSPRYRKNLFVNVQPKIAVYDEAKLFFSKKPGVSYKTEPKIVPEKF